MVTHLSPAQPCRPKQVQVLYWVAHAVEVNSAKPAYSKLLSLEILDQTDIEGPTLCLVDTIRFVTPKSDQQRRYSE